MIAPAATFSGAWASAIVETISIGTTTPPVPQTCFANGASAQVASIASTPADELEAERDLEQAAEPPPALRLRVAEAELDERLLDRQVEELLEEDRGRVDGGELRVVVEAELAGRDDRCEEAEPGRNVGPDRRRRASPDDSGAHRGTQYKVCASLARLRAADVLALVAAAAIPLIFLHGRYQAHLAVGQDRRLQLRPRGRGGARRGGDRRLPVRLGAAPPRPRCSGCSRPRCSGCCSSRASGGPSRRSGRT